MPIARSVCAMACAVVLTSACTDTTAVAPALHRTKALSASMTNAAPASHPNSQKYRDSGVHPATGRSGSAVVSTRALVDKSGTTDVEVTTGTFDDTLPAPGTLATVQVKAYSRSGKYVFTDNHTGLSGGGTAIFPYTVLPHGTPLEVQTLVRGVDDPRTDVVTLADTVHLRPDLVAWRLQPPAQSPMGDWSGACRRHATRSGRRCTVSASVTTSVRGSSTPRTRVCTSSGVPCGRTV